MKKIIVKKHAYSFFNWSITVDPRPFMTILGMFTALWGAWLMMPWVTTFNNPIYDTIAFFAPETVWGAVLFVVGVGKIVHAFRPIDTVSFVIVLIASSLWTFIFVAFVVSAFRTTAIPVYGQVVLWNAWLLYRIQGERLDGRTRS